MKSGLLAVLAATLLPATAGAQTSTADIAPRTELHAIPTMTLSDSDFLAGKDGKAVTVAGQLRIAQDTGKLPVVVLIHGSGGMARTSMPGAASSTPWVCRPLRSTASPAAA